jgi:hypothetical protein
MSTVLPWDLQPALREERLVTLARLVAEVRNKVFAEADREAGDTNWGLACRAHERLGHALVRTASEGTYPWLSVSREGLYLMPLIDGIPVKPYRGAPQKPGSRNLDAVRGETSRSQPKQTAFSFMDGLDTDGPWFWLMALETDEAGRIAKVTFLQANEAGETRHPWVCPLDAPAPVEAPKVEPRRAAPPRAAARRARSARPAAASEEPVAVASLFPAMAELPIAAG